MMSTLRRKTPIALSINEMGSQPDVAAQIQTAHHGNPPNYIHIGSGARETDIPSVLPLRPTTGDSPPHPSTCLARVSRRAAPSRRRLAIASSAKIPDFSFSRYATVSPAEDWSFVSGQFAGDNMTDVVGYHPSNGSL